MTITLEKLTSPIYPAFLNVGDYSIALEPSLITDLKDIAEAEDKPGPFLEKVVEKIGINRYLREMIEEEIKNEENLTVMSDRLREEIKSF